MDHGMRFTVYKRHFELADGQLIERQFIVLRYPDRRLQFTEFHKYIVKSASSAKRIESDGNNRFDFVVKLLNYVYFDRGVERFNDVTIDIISDFLHSYGLCQLPGDSENTTRSRDTVIRCVRCILSFVELYIEQNEEKCRIKKSSLYKRVNRRNKYGRVISEKAPVFDVKYKVSPKKEIYRDIPNKCFNILFSHIVSHRKDLLGLVLLSAFGGLRPSESCNIRAVDSPLGAGIHFWDVDGHVYKIELVLTKELKLREDNVSVGKIKKERVQIVPDIFRDAFMHAYRVYADYLATQKRDMRYGAFTVNKQGNAITYKNYLQKFQKMITEEVIPIFLSSSDPDVVLYGKILAEEKLAPHVFRHWFTVQLVLSGISEPGVLMKLRGDRSEKSALRYLADKSDLEKKYRLVTNEVFDYFKWEAENHHKNSRST